MMNILTQGTQYIKKDALIAAIIMVVLVFAGSPYLNSQGFNILIFWVLVFVLWKFKKVNIKLLSIARIIQLISVLSILLGFLFLFRSPLTNIIRFCSVAILGLSIQSTLYYYLTIWTTILKQGKNIEMINYKSPLLVIGVATVALLLFGQEIVGLLFKVF